MKVSRKISRLRQQVAFEAARILATEGQRNYLHAKQKAAERVGLTSRQGLPSNSEIEAALKSWQNLHGGASHAAALRTKRQHALEAMRYFDAFSPRLVGPVLEGTADEHARVCLHLFSDDPDEVPRFLMENKHPFEQETRRIRWHNGDHRNVEIVAFEAGEQTVELLLLDTKDARQAPPSPVDGRPQRRAGMAEVKRLLEPVESLEEKIRDARL